MSKTKIIAALDVGSTKIATLIAQITEDPATFETTVNVVGVAASDSKGIRKGQIVDIDEAVESIISSVEAAERMAGYNLTSAFVSLGGAHVHSQNSHGVVAVSDPEGEIESNDVGRVLEAASAISLPQSREVIHVLPREFIVDGEAGVRDPIGMSGIRLEVETHIVTGAVASIKNLAKALNEVGIQIEDLVFSGLASSEAILSSTEKELGCVLVDIGGGTTSVAAYLDGALSYSGVLPVGAKNVTNDLAIGLRVSLESAEKIKIALGMPESKKTEGDQMELKEIGIDEVKKISKKTLTEGIVRPRLNEIFTMVRLDLERAGIANRVPSGVIVTGGGALTVGAADSAKRMLSLPVRIGVPRGIGGLVDDIITPPFASAVGLLIHASKQANKDSQGQSKKMKLPSLGIAGKFIDAIKNLLP